MTPETFLAQQPADRRAALATVRDVILANLPNGYEESVSKGMLVYSVPLARYAKTPKKQPVWYVALAAEKKFNSLHLMSVYGSPKQEQKLRDACARAGKRLDMGKACIHFMRADDLPLDSIGEIVSSVSVDRWISIFESSRQKPSRRKNA